MPHFLVACDTKGTIDTMVIKMFFMVLFALGSSGALAQEARSIPQGGRWVPAGTFALSNLGNNAVRGEKSYYGAGREDRRIATYLPGMTIVYNVEESSLAQRRGYVDGITHAGIRVAVLETDLSRGTFDARATQDVVIHQRHTACRDLACNGSSEVGTGFSFRIIEEDNEKIVLYNPTNELQLVYTKDKLSRLEAHGFLTRVKDRVHPRLKMYDGYARELSTSCGATRDTSPQIRVSKDEYDRGPSEWLINSDSWSLKALEIFDMGKVEPSQDGKEYVGTLADAIGTGTESANRKVALDFTVVAYRDSEWTDATFFKFAGIAQTVTCRRGQPGFGRLRPMYVENAYLYFDRVSGEERQLFPLNAIKMPEQIADPDIKQKLVAYLPRAFFYSINSAQAYYDVFEKIVETTHLNFPSAVANIIARLNASCSQGNRKECSCIVAGVTLGRCN